ncbi:hypothetical protein ScPMuIL_014848 [Solemya velum]
MTPALNIMSYLLYQAYFEKMGITGLLPFLKKIHTPVNIGQFEGCTVAIDAYCWLHKGAFSCAEKLAMGESTDQYVYYCMKYVENLLKKNIKPILVFDGCHLPSKKDVETSRREKRDLYKKKAAALLREGNRAEARECLRRCVDITPQMALQLMNVCRERGVDCIVAPYEADAQLAYLNKCGIAQIIITEDSDLLLFGCEKVIFKMDFFGNGILIEKSKLNEVVQIQNGFYTFDKFRYMCILSGCDYLSSLQGIGLVKACKVFKTARNPDLRQVLKKMSTYLNNMNLTVTAEYIEGFMRADNTFLYQLSFDPQSRKLVPLNPYPPDVKKEDLVYAGAYMTDKRALQIALGNLNIYSGEIFASFDPDTFVPSKANKKKANELHRLSIWDRNYRVQPKIVKSTPANGTERPNLKGKEVVVNTKLWRSPQKSPRKRVRSAEESEYFHCDRDLSKIYNDSPPSKKIKTSTDEFDPKPAYIATPLFRISPSKENEIEDEDSPPPLPVERKKPMKFFESLKGANEFDDGKNDNIAPSPLKDDKENNSVSPLNKFAIASPSKRERFDINAKKCTGSKESVKSPMKFSLKMLKTSRSPRKNIFSLNAQKKTNRLNIITEVKSRYFKSDQLKPAESSKTDFEMIKPMKEDEGDTASDSKKENISSDNDLVLEEPSSQCSTSSTGIQSSQNSPASAFSWSKFKFLKQSSQSNNTPSKAANKQFKSVISRKTPGKNYSGEANRKSITDSFKSSDSTKTADSTKIMNLTQTVDYSEFIREQQGSSQTSDISQSQKSNLYSIDSDCMPDTQDLGRSLDSDSVQDNDIDLQDNSSDFVSRLEKQHDIEMETLKLEDRTESVPGEANSMRKSGCRISGLSKKRSKSNLKDDVKQKSIKDMLSRFAHSGDPKKLGQNTPPKEVEDDIEIISVTPTSGKLNNKPQRKLLP